MAIGELLNRNQSTESTDNFRKLTPLARREALNGFLFISPWIIGFLAFTLIPMIASLIFSFTDLRLGMVTPTQWNNFENYKTLLVDPQVGSSLLVVLKFGLFSLPVGILAPLLLALLMNSKHLKAAPVFRTLFYLPYIIPFVAAVFIWGGMLNSETGWINETLRWLGVQNTPLWVDSVTWVYPAYVILGIWGIGNSMLIFLASLQNVPTELYDAARVDGAGWLATTFNVTFPLISPVIFYTLVLAIVELFQYFLVPLVVKNGTGAPNGATMFYNLYLYKTFFVFQNMSYGSALAWVLFIIILIITLILFKTAKYWVYYAGDTGK
ncbi:MAG: sugar ABC transporter permease [Chloroflexi bacterium HGW-Chloroflexi-10]|nr:MAG: sugar ABC transporter permease [Chloroflexi bacterium HGW-Chloroflexi-10]